MASEDPDLSLRASDAERETVVERLQVALSEGRLSVTEFDERARDAYAAMTRGDLAALTADLPEAELKPAVPEHRRCAELMISLGVLTVVWAVLSVLSGGLAPFLPVVPMGVWALVLLAGMFFRDGPQD
jgi:hypothetical protein